ncbi:MAG: TIGR03435 family protein [Bryobacteraceae bacterium]
MTSTVNQIVLLLAATAVPAWPQARFEVASIRPSQPKARVGSINFHGDRFEAKAVRVGDILDMLNGYQLLRVVGGPDWMRTDRYDIEAKADRPLEVGDRNDAVMALLAERFQLRSHRETREMSAFVLRAPRTPAGLKQAGTDERYSMRMDRGDFVYTAASMSTLTNRLTQMLMTPVVDETELKGTYDFELAISRVELQPGMNREDRVREAVEAMGFRLENRRIPLEVTVVDRCERPSAN